MSLLRREGPRVNRMMDMAPPEVSRAYDDLMAPASAQFDVAVRTILGHRPESVSVLDVGTGPGFLPPRLARAYPAATITGLDSGPEMLAIARERSAAEGVADRVEFVQGDAYAMPFADASFDLVVATRAIHMFDDLPAFVLEAHRVLVPGGHLVVLDMRRDVLWPLWAIMWGSSLVLRALREPISGMGPVIDACYTKGELAGALSSAGFPRHEVSIGEVRLEAWAQA